MGVTCVTSAEMMSFPVFDPVKANQYLLTLSDFARLLSS